MNFELNLLYNLACFDNNILLVNTYLFLPRLLIGFGVSIIHYKEFHVQHDSI